MVKIDFSYGGWILMFDVESKFLIWRAKFDFSCEGWNFILVRVSIWTAQGLHTNYK
jgi:hypothetical protein